MLEKIKLALRIDDNDLDSEINDEIEAAKADLILSGVLKENIIDDDPLIIRAIKIYCKIEFSSSEQEAERYKNSYDMLKSHLTLSSDYTVSKNVE